MTSGGIETPLRIDICVCTFRRAELAATLRSLARIEVPSGWDVHVIVADNDTFPTARELVEDLRAEIPHTLRYVHAPARNISVARNACLEHASGEFLAFIDDDETASPGWLAELVATAERTGAEAVLGPVRAVYDEDAPGWMRRGDFHSTFPVWVKGEIRTGYTCNVLIRREASAVTGRRFDPALGQSGGEDTDYFSRLCEAGGSIAYAPEAWLYEPVPPGRASFGWLARRRFRIGQTHGRLLRERSSAAAIIPQLGLASAKMAYCFAIAGALSLFSTRRNRSILRGIMHAGVVGGLLGLRELRQYGQVTVMEGGGHAA